MRSPGFPSTSLRARVASGLAIFSLVAAGLLAVSAASAEGFPLIDGRTVSGLPPKAPEPGSRGEGLRFSVSGATTATLANGTGDTTAVVTVDPYGSFGSSSTGGQFKYDPVGPIPSSSAIYRSRLWFSGANRAGLGGAGRHLDKNDLGVIAFETVEPTRTVSRWFLDGLQFQLEQILLPATSGGSVLRQVYTIHNPGSFFNSFDIIRYVDADLAFDSSISDYAGARIGGQELFAFEVGPAFDQNTIFIGIHMAGTANLGFQIDDLIEGKIFDDGRAALQNQVVPDANGDRIVDRPYDLSLNQGRTFNLAPGQTAVFPVFTTAGSAPPTSVLYAPDAPSNLRATAVGTSRIRLDWEDTGNDEDGFLIERRTAGGLFQLVGTAGMNATSYEDIGLAPDTQYFFRVSATNKGVPSEPSNEAAARTFPEAPQPPSGLRVLTVGTTELRLHWMDNSAAEQGFGIERSPDGLAFTPIDVTGPNVTTYLDRNLNPGTLYFYRVRAGNQGGLSAYSDTASGTTRPLPPDVPGSLSVAPLSNRELRLSWQNGTNAGEGLEIERSENGIQFVPVARAPRGAISYVDGGLQGDREYFYRVRAFDRGEVSPYVGPASAKTLPDPPFAPGNLTATVVSPTALRLDWVDTSPNETGFRIERRVGTEEFRLLTQVGENVTSFLDGAAPETALVPNTVYVYRVRAENGGGHSSWSNEAIGVTPPPAPAAPTELTGQVIVDGSGVIGIRLAWKDNALTESGFEVERALGDGLFHRVHVLGANITVAGDFPLAPRTRYQYRVRAINAGGPSAYSNVLEATTPPGVPAPPHNLAVRPLSTTELELTWQLAPGAANVNVGSGIRVERADPGSGFRLIAELGDATSYVDRNLTPGTTYRYRLQAFNEGGNSPYSDVVEGRTPTAVPLAPSDLSAVVISDTVIALTWRDQSGDEERFEIEAKRGSEEFQLLARVSANVNTFFHTSLPAGTSVTYRVRAVNAGGASGYSNEAGATTAARASTGKLVVTPQSLKFKSGKGAAGVETRKVVTLKNTGKGVLQVSVGSAGSPFGVASGGGSFALAPGARRQVVVTYGGGANNSASGELPIASGDKQRPLTRVRLSAGK